MEPTWDNEVKSAPKKLSIKQWSIYLRRNLSKKEKMMFQNVRYESGINGVLGDLYATCEPRNLYVPELTTLVGNCLFESLNYHGVGKSSDDLRLAVSFFIHHFRDYPNLVPGDSSTLSERFDIEKFGGLPEHVYCFQNDKIYPYTFSVMCQDLADDRSWTKLPTNMIMMIISYIFQLRIVVVHSGNDQMGDLVMDGWENADAEHKLDTKTIYLGQLSESHYVPLDTLGDDEVVDPIIYDEAYHQFLKWRDIQVNKMYRRHVDDFNTSKHVSHGYSKTVTKKPSNMFSALDDSDSSDSEAPEKASSSGSSPVADIHTKPDEGGSHTGYDPSATDFVSVVEDAEF